MKRRNLFRGLIGMGAAAAVTAVPGVAVAKTEKVVEVKPFESTGSGYADILKMLDLGLVSRSAAAEMLGMTVEEMDDPKDRLINARQPFPYDMTIGGQGFVLVDPRTVYPTWNSTGLASVKVMPHKPEDGRIEELPVPDMGPTVELESVYSGRFYDSHFFTDRMTLREIAPAPDAVRKKTFPY